MKRNEGPIVRPWGLWGIDGKGGWWIPANDCVGEPTLAFTSEEAAAESAKAHLDTYGITCVPKLLDMAPAHPTAEVLTRISNNVAKVLHAAEGLLSLPILEHQKDRLYIVYSSIALVVQLLGKKAVDVAMGVNGHERPPLPPLPPVQVTPAVDRPIAAEASTDVDEWGERWINGLTQIDVPKLVASCKKMLEADGMSTELEGMEEIEVLDAGQGPGQSEDPAYEEAEEGGAA